MRGEQLSNGTLEVGNKTALGTGTLAMADGTTLTFTNGSFMLGNNITISGTSNIVPPSGTTQSVRTEITTGVRAQSAGTARDPNPPFRK